MTVIAIRNLLLLGSALLMAALVTWGVRSYNELLREDGRQEIRAAWHRAQVDADLVERDKEQARRKALKEIERESNESRDRAAADAAGARAAADGLRKQLAAYLAAGRAAGGDPAAAGNGQAAGDPLGVLADVLERADRRAGALADFADAARIAGQQCERAYDALTAAGAAP